MRRETSPEARAIERFLKLFANARSCPLCVSPEGQKLLGLRRIRGAC